MNAPVEVVPLWWEIGKAVLLFAITGLLGFAVRLLWSMRDKVVDHEQAIYGKNGENGLKRALAAVSGRVKLIEDRNMGIDAVAEAERDGYTGPERRHSALRIIVEMVAAEMRREQEKGTAR